MTVVLLVVVAWTVLALILGILIGRAMKHADRREARQRNEAYFRTAYPARHAPFRAQLDGLHMARERCPDCLP